MMLKHFIKRKIKVSEDVKIIINDYDWPGNISELKNTIKSAVAMCRGASILVEDLPKAIGGIKTKRPDPANTWILAEWIQQELVNCEKSNKKGSYYNAIMEQVEKEILRQMIERTNGKKIETAEMLGITRNTLRAKMAHYGLG